jgi:hypothetical protein
VCKHYRQRASFRAQRGISLCVAAELKVAWDAWKKDQSEIPRSVRNDKVVSWFLGAAGGMSDCHENACAEGTLEYGSSSYRLAYVPHEPKAVAAATALQGASRIFMQRGEPKDHGHLRSE